MSSKIQKIIEKKSYAVEFVTTINAAKEAVFAFLLMPAEYVQTFRKKLQTESLDLKDHGVVLAAGKGHTPSEEVRQDILSKFPNANV